MTSSSGAKAQPTAGVDALEQSLLRDLRSSERQRRIVNVVVPIVVAVVFVVLWEVWVKAFSIPLYLIPAPSAVFDKFVKNGPILMEATRVTAIEILLGYLFSIVIGLPLAVAIFSSPLFAKVVYPVLLSTQAIPKVAIAPLFVIWFGFGLLPKIVVAFLIAFFPIVIDTVIGLNSIQVEKLYLARSMGMGPVETFLKIRLPEALPSIFGGLKIAITLAVVGAVVGEFVGSDAGLGYLLLKANGVLDSALLFAALVVLTVLGVVFFAAVALLERLVIPWHREMTARLKAGSL